MQEKKNNNTSLLNNAALILMAGSGGAGLTAISRYFNQKNIDPNLIEIRSGSAKNNGSLEIQRKSWANEFAKRNYAVKELAHFPSYDIQKSFGGVTSVRKYNNPNPHRNPLVRLDVSKPYYPTSIHTRYFKGIPTYRVFSDFGYGPQRQVYTPIEDMRAAMLPYYNRNVVPGGDLVPAKNVILGKLNINVTTIPTDEVFNTQSKFAPSKSGEKIRAVITPGGGVQYGRLFRKPDYLANTILAALEAKYGEGNTSISFLSGLEETDSRFKKLKEKINSKINIIPGIPRAEMPTHLTNTDYLFMAPGSTIAEISAISGKKPNIISFSDEYGLGGGQGQFLSNPEWYKKSGGNLERVDLKNLNTETLVNAINTVSRNTDDFRNGIRITDADIAKIVDTAKLDLEAAKNVTKHLRNASIIAGGAGIGLYSLKKYLDNKE